MKKTLLAFGAISLLLGLSACLPKTSTGSNSGSSTNTSQNQSPPWWATATPTPTPTVTWYYTATPTPTPTGTYSACNDPLGDCSSAYPVINLPITKRGQLNSSEAPNVYNSWNSDELGGFITDGRLRVRLAVNPPPPRAECGLSGSYANPAYTKLKGRITVYRGASAIWSQTLPSAISVNQTSQIYDVPVANFPSANPYKVVVSYVTTDTTCAWQSAPHAPGQGYCANQANAAWCGCPSELPDGSNCWSVNLQVSTSQTNNFK